MSTSTETKPSLGSQFTKLTASFVTGFILYKLLNKLNKSKSNPNIKIDSLHIYPVKSLAGFEVDNWSISKYGLKYDREWMIYNPKNKRFVCQRQVNKLALIKPELIKDKDNKNVIALKLSAPNMESIIVSIVKNECDENKISDITLWKDKVTGIDQGDDISKWLTKYINNGRKYRLLRIGSKNYKRETNPKYTPNHLNGLAESTYSDGYPYLFVSKSSLNKVNDELKKRGFNEIPMNRFRPNIVIKTDLNEAFIEDRISRLILIPKYLKFDQKMNCDKLNKESITFYLTHPCPRCQIPTIDQNTGIKNKNHEPTLTLRTFRSGKHLGLNKDKYEDVFFGVNAIHNNFDQTKIINKGDSMLAFFK